MNVAVIASRDFNDYESLSRILKALLHKHGPCVTIISGGARGADSLAERFCDENNVDKIIFKPNKLMSNYGYACYLRNQQIIDKCDAVIAFWDGKSRGTKHAIDLARQQNKPVKLVRFK